MNTIKLKPGIDHVFIVGGDASQSVYLFDVYNSSTNKMVKRKFFLDYSDAINAKNLWLGVDSELLLVLAEYKYGSVTELLDELIGQVDID